MVEVDAQTCTNVRRVYAYTRRGADLGKRSRRRNRERLGTSPPAGSSGRSLPADQQMARVNITADDWLAFRTEALRQRRSVADYLGELVRRELQG